MAKQKAKELTPQDYMQMAIDEMEKSIHEPRADGKINPKVGAVLIKPDGSVGLSRHKSRHFVAIARNRHRRVAGQLDFIIN